MLAQDGAVEPPEAGDLGVLGPALLDGDGDERSAADLQRRSGGGRGGGGRGGGRSGSLLGDTDTDSRGEGPPPAVDALPPPRLPRCAPRTRSTHGRGSATPRRCPRPYAIGCWARE
jgi:hypothetical protein